MGEFGWSHILTIGLFAVANILAIARAWVAFRERAAQIETRVEALSKDKVPVLECHDKHATEREANRIEHMILNGNLRRLSEQGVSPANPHPKIDPLPGQEWEA